jgi:hypothetical protein
MAEPDLKTLDGERTRVEDMNLDVPLVSSAEPSGFLGRLAKIYKNLSLVMAGMYTGLNCYGTPHSHRKGDATKNKPDNRLI